jgi:beta-glucosidase
VDYLISSRLKRLKKHKGSLLKKPIKKSLFFWDGRDSWLRNYFSHSLGLSSTWDMKLIERSAQIAAQEASADGINWTFSPVDVSRDPRWEEFRRF